MDGNIGVDLTRRPLVVPPAMGVYAEKHELFQLFEEMLKTLIVDRPADPLEAVVAFLRQRPGPASTELTPRLRVSRLGIKGSRLPYAC